MGRSVSVDKSERHAGDPGGEAPQDNPNKYAARGRSLGEPHNSSRTAVAPRKRWPSTSERGTMTRATGSSSLFSSASASNSSYELARQTTSPGVRSPSRSSQIDRLDSTAKSFLSSTSKALKRHASKLSLASSISLDKNEEGKVVWKLSALGAAEQESIDSSARKETLKRTISAPFGFKHITHTYHEQVRGLESVSRNELISEFSAIRAGQRADPQLRGIKVQSLVTQGTPSSPDTTESKPEPLSPSTNITPPTDPLCSEAESSSNGSNTASDAHSSRSMENFSRPVSRTSFSPISPPKRISSVNACKPGFGGSGRLNTNYNVRSPRTGLQRTSRSASNPGSSPVGLSLPDQDRDVVTVGHAISTTDDSARHLKASPLPMLPVDLDDVPEDEEGFVQPGSRLSLVGRSNRLQPLRHVQSFPTGRHDAVQHGFLASNSPDTQTDTKSISEGNTPLSLEGCLSNWPESPSHQSYRDTRRFSIGLKPMLETQHWEEDVDYCYEHAAEAESDFDWERQEANFPVGLLPLTFDSSDSVEKSLSELQELAGLGLHDRKHDSQESSVLSIAASIVDITRSSNSVASLPELDYSVNSSRESMDWEACHGNQRSGGPARRSQPTSPAKSVKARQGLGLSYSLFPSTTTTSTPPRTP